MHKLIIVVMGTCLLLFGFVGFASAQEKQEDVKVRLRLLPVTVVGTDGKPVKGLTAEDFELMVDGKPMQIRNVDEYDYGVIREQVRKGQPIEYTGAELPPRRIILLFDLLSSGIKGYQKMPGEDRAFFAREASSQLLGGDQPDIDRQRGIRMSKGAARRWIENEMLPTDEVAIVQYHLSAQMLQPFTSKKESLLRAIDGISIPQDAIGPEFSDPFPEEDLSVSNALPSANINQIGQLTNAYLNFYERLGELLASLPGTKDVILFSEGLIVHAGSDRETLSYLPELQKATMKMASANGRIASISIAGLDRPRTDSYQDEFLFQMANDTGGTFYPGRARLDNVLREASESFDHFYEVFFSPDPNEGTGFHNVEVRLKSTKAKVTAPPGYLGERTYDQLSGVQQEIHLQQGFWQPLLNELGSEMSWRALPYGNGKTALHIRSFIPPEQLENNDRTKFDAFLAIGREGKKFDDVRWRVERKLIAGGAAQFDFLIPLPEGLSSFQFVVMDRESGDRAYLMDGVEVGKSSNGISMSPIYLLRQQALDSAVNIEQTKKPKFLTETLPEALVRLSTAAQIVQPTGGEQVVIAFIFKGPDFDQAAIQFVRDEDKFISEARSLSQEPIADGLRLVSFSVELPRWKAGELSLTPLYAAKGKVYALLASQLTLY